MASFLNRNQPQPSVSLEELESRLGKVETEIGQLKELNLKNIHKVGMVRFNPFNETGGNISFVVALLDGNNSGVVVTSLHSRLGTRVYAKQIQQGKAELELSQDEQKAILNAINEKRK